MVCLVLAVRRSRSHTLDQGQGQALGLSVEVLNQEEGQGGILLERDHCASHHRVAVAVAAGAAAVSEEDSVREVRVETLRRMTGSAW